MADALVMQQSFNQGTGGYASAYPAGTSGMGTCVGFAVEAVMIPGNQQVWWCSHWDCITNPPSRNGTCVTFIAQWVQNTLNTAFLTQVVKLKRCVAVAPNAEGFSTAAILAGMQEWANNMEIQMESYTGVRHESFYIMTETADVKVSNQNWDNNYQGDVVCTVPLFPGCT